MRLRRRTTLFLTLGTAVALVLQAGPAAAHPGDPGPGDGPVSLQCTPNDTVHVPGAELAVTACLPDITTAGLLQAPAGQYTDQADWLSLHAPGTANPSGVPGLQVDGYFRTPRPSTPPTAGTTTASSCCVSRTTGTVAWW